MKGLEEDNAGSYMKEYKTKLLEDLSMKKALCTP